MRALLSSASPILVAAVMACVAHTAPAGANDTSDASAALLASTFLGARNEESAVDLAVGPDGSIYVLLFALSPRLPTTPGAFDRTYNRPGPDEFGGDAYLARLDANASTLLYATYLGGTDTEYPHALAVGTNGDVYITGYTYSPNFPTTPGAYRTDFAGGCCDAFVTVLDGTGRMRWSTFLGGSSLETSQSLFVTDTGEVVITGETLSPDLPTTPQAWDRTLNDGGASYSDAFAARLDASGSELLWASYLGGTFNDYGIAVAVAADGRLFVGGRSMALDFPTTPGAYDRTQAGGGSGDGTVTAFTPDGSALSYSTYLGGGDDDEVWALAVDAVGSVYLTGYTGSVDFPTTPDAFDRVCEGCFFADVFVSRLDPSGSTLLYSTFIGGAETDTGNDIALLDSGVVLVAGTTHSPDFPTTPNALSRSLGGSADAFLTRLRPGQRMPGFSSYLGGTDNVIDAGAAVEAAGSSVAIVAGQTHSEDFPVTPDAYDTSYNGDFDAFVSRVRMSPGPAAR